MKKIFLAILMIFSLSLTIPLVVYAQDSSTTSDATAQTAQEQTTNESTQGESFNFSFGTILVAVITPLLLIIVCYLIIKTMKI